MTESEQNPRQPDGINLTREDVTTLRQQVFDAIWRRVRDRLWLTAIIALFVGASTVLFAYDRAKSDVRYYILQEVGKTILITVFVAVVSNALIVSQTEEIEKQRKILEEKRQEASRKELGTGLAAIHKESVNELNVELKELTNRIGRSASSLGALQLAGVAQLYSGRKDAADDIQAALTDDHVQQVKLIGISLNDFVREENAPLHLAMNHLEQRIRDANASPDRPHAPLRVQVLLIDPDCRGAFLRANAEEKGDKVARLRRDVDWAMDYFRRLEKLQAHPDVRLEARLYRTEPMLHLIWTNMAAFVQQYYFRPSRDVQANFPFLKYQPLKAESVESRVHADLDHHFEWIWRHASIPIAEYREKHSRGVDTALRQANIRNIYYDPDESRKRILQLIETTEERLWIKGVSLHTFFTFGEIFAKIVAACRRNVEVKVLLIDPTGEQAKYRSFREFLLKDASATLESFDNERMNNERLVLDTKACLRFIESRKAGGEMANLDCRCFRSAPEAFLLLTDDAVLVEQYHYGSMTTPGPEGHILNGKVPVIEYKRFTEEDQRDNALLQDRDPLKDPYEIYKDHLAFVIKHCCAPIPSGTLSEVGQLEQTASSSRLMAGSGI